MNPDKIFFTADTHLGHKLMAVLRGFATQDEMRDDDLRRRKIDEHDDHIIDQWNSVVPPDGEVFHLGDVALCHPQRARYALRRLNGKIYLIQGSHDKKLISQLGDRFEWIKDQHILWMPGPKGKQQIVMNHTAFLVWDKSHYGSWNFFGHSHGRLTLEPHKLQIDVGIDALGRPISYTEAVEIMAPRVAAWTAWRAEHPLGKKGDEDDD